MKRRRRYLILVVILVFSIGLGIYYFVSSQAKDSNPYLQYYSNAEDAYVIERADGSQQILFSSARTIKWSASGKWYSPPASVIQVMRTENETLNERFVRYNDTGWLEWSPQGDILGFVTTSTANPKSESEENHRQLVVWDVEADAILHNLYLIDETDTAQFKWSTDGRYLAGLYTVIMRDDGVDVTRSIRRILSTDTDLAYVDKFMILDIETGEVFETPVNPVEVIAFSLGGWVISYDGANLTGQNVFTDSSFEFPFTDDLGAIEWCPAQDKAFIFSWYRNREYSVTILDENGFRSLVADTPSAMNADDLSNGLGVKYYQKAHLFDFCSPDSKWGFFRIDNVLQAINLTSGEFADNFGLENAVQWIWHDDLLWVETQNSDSQISIRQYEFGESAKLVKEVKIPREQSLTWFTPSPNGRYVGFSGERRDIWDLEKMEQVVRIPTPNIENYNFEEGIGGYIWSADSEWVILSYLYKLPRSPRSNSQIVLVMYFNGEDSRLIDECEYCIQWLPQDVADYLPEQDE